MEKFLLEKNHSGTLQRRSVCNVKLFGCLDKTNSAIADKPHDAFRGQSRSPNMTPFDMLGMVSY